MKIFQQFGWLLLFDAVVILILIAAMIPLKVFKRASFSVLKRNFVAYFSNPTGYVFICVFVAVSSYVAFWLPEFFARNLATLDQLNRWFPFIMLVFVPSITMSVWAEERREGTDELLLTIPASDTDIVVGKYLAAAAIFTVSLMFSQITNFLVLDSLSLGDIDLGLFLATYFGYWLVGLAMLALGMAASFLTGNLTIAFILGALFNFPLAVMGLFSGSVHGLSWWSYSGRFHDFGRGMLSLPSILFFALVVLLGVYICVVFIGRRHWAGAQDANARFLNYLLRAASIAVLIFTGTLLVYNVGWLNRIRFDATSGKINSLSPDTKQLLKDLDSQHPVAVEAFLSKSVPEQYVKTKIDLRNKLREFEAVSGGKVQVTIHDDLESFTDQAARAEEQYGIEAQNVMTRERGALRQEELYMGAAFTHGLERFVIPFFDRGIPVEYELVRSITRVTEEKRLKVGLVKTDAELMGGFDMQMMRQRPQQLIIDELEKQYDVEEVTLDSPPTAGAFDVLLVVQPSSLPAPQLNHLIQAIRDGQPTAIFEDPFPVAISSAPGTGQPRRPQGGGMMGMMGGGGRQPEPKGDIRQLWSLLGIEMVGEPSVMTDQFDAHVIWQAFNPYKNMIRVRNITKEWVFISPDAPGADDPLNSQDPVTSGLTQLLLLFPGAIENKGADGLTFTPLVTTGAETGTIRFDDLRNTEMDPRFLDFKRELKRKRYVMAARIAGTLKHDLTSSGGAPTDVAGPSTEDEATPEEVDKTVNVIYVADIDMLHSDFLSIRAQPDQEIPWQFDNVTFALNVIDLLAGEDRLIGIRKRQTRHSTLKMVEEQTEQARRDAQEEIAGFEEEFDKAKTEAEDRIRQKSRDLQKTVDEMQQQGEAVDLRELRAAERKLQIQLQLEQARLDTAIENARTNRDQRLKNIQLDLDKQVRSVQNTYKYMAAFIPPLLPLMFGLLVWATRYAREREGVSAARLR